MTRHALLVEDTPYVRDIHRELLEDLGYTVTCAETHREFLVAWWGRLDCTSGAGFDLLVLDNRIPSDVGGVPRAFAAAMVKLVRMDDASVRVVVCSGDLLDIDGAAYVSKGNPARLRAKVEEMS